MVKQLRKGCTDGKISHPLTKKKPGMSKLIYKIEIIMTNNCLLIDAKKVGYFVILKQTLQLIPGKLLVY